LLDLQDQPVFQANVEFEGQLVQLVHKDQKDLLEPQELQETQEM